MWIMWGGRPRPPFFHSHFKSNSLRHVIPAKQLRRLLLFFDEDLLGATKQQVSPLRFPFRSGKGSSGRDDSFREEVRGSTDSSMLRTLYGCPILCGFQR